MKRLMGYVVIFFGFFVLMAISANWQTWWLGQFLDAPSIIWLVFAIVGVILITGENKTFIVAINAIINKRYVLPEQTRDKAIRLFRMISKAVYGSAVIAVASSIVIMLLTLDDPSALGPMLSVSLLSAVYAAFINFVFFHPAIYLLENRRNAEQKILINERQVIDKMLELCYRQGITPEEIINAEEISFRKQDE
ncbi:MAG: hypothetical protein FWC16_02070 [Defluviitaleaceae bacterium]|nr:hypothetical protein [Defluviitaleaceae bacterium]MCL2273686.1 hypothetical protein [Defluviitaleaceae bacterium]